MKKILLFLFAIVLFCGCSNDDPDEVKISFTANELKQIEGVEVGKYFISADPATEQIRYAIYVPYTDINESVSLACNAVCANDKHTHTKGNYIRLMPDYREYYCPQCGARYNTSNGAPLNTEAGSFYLQVYNITYNSRTKMFHLTPQQLPQ